MGMGEGSAFCPATPGSCPPLAGCERGCQTCTVPRVGGDHCSAPLLLGGREHLRVPVSTCGAANDINLRCTVFGPDLAIGLLVEVPGRVRVRAATEPGVGLALAYDPFPLPCMNDLRERSCVGPFDMSNNRAVDFNSRGGTHHIFVATSRPATVVLDIDLP